MKTLQFWQVPLDVNLTSTVPYFNEVTAATVNISIKSFVCLWRKKHVEWHGVNYEFPNCPSCFLKLVKAIGMTQMKVDQFLSYFLLLHILFKWFLVNIILVGLYRSTCSLQRTSYRSEWNLINLTIRAPYLCLHVCCCVAWWPQCKMRYFR